MFRSGTRRAFLAALSGALLLAATTPARADLLLSLQEGATVVNVQVPNNKGPASFSGTVGDFSIFISVGSSNSPGGSTGLAQAGTFSIVNNSGSAQTLHINMSAQGFTSPNSPPPLMVLDTVSGSVANGSVKGTFQGFADALDKLSGQGFASGLLTFSAGGLSQSFSQNGGTFGFSPNGSTYSLSIFSDYTLSGGAQFTGTVGNVQTMPTPAPASLQFLLVGLPLVGLACLRRRRPAQAV
jgi:hypothetical protein